MRASCALLLLAVVAAANPPSSSTDFLRLRDFRDQINSRLKQMKEEEEFASKPDEEKMVLAYFRGDKKLGKEDLTGLLVVKTVFKWPEMLQPQQSEAVKRVLALLPEALNARYGNVIDIPKDRAKIGEILLKGLDSEFLHVRSASLLCLQKVYKKQDAMMYEASMDKKQRASAIKSWQKFVDKQDSRQK